MNNPHELKELQVRKAKLDAEIKALEGDRDKLQAEIARKRNDLNKVNQSIAQFTAREPTVSEHAMLRYIERALGIDLQEIQNQILKEPRSYCVRGELPDQDGRYRAGCEG